MRSLTTSSNMGMNSVAGGLERCADATPFVRGSTSRVRGACALVIPVSGVQPPYPNGQGQTDEAQ
jgi:hypothetical protein